MRKLLFFKWVFVVLLSFGVSSAKATTSFFSAINQPHAFSHTDYIFTPGAAVLEPRQFFLQTSFDYYYRPMEFTVAGNRLRGVNDHLLMQNFSAGIGVLKRWQIELHMAVAWFNRFSDPNSGVESFGTALDMGDITFQSRVQIFDPETKWLGVTVLPYLQFPAGNDGHYVSEDRITGGLDIALEHQFSEKFSLALSNGVKFRDSVVFRDYITKHLFRTSLGAKFDIGQRWDVRADVAAETNLSSKFFKDRVTSPVEAAGQVTYKIPNIGMDLFLSGGRGVIRSPGASKFRECWV